MGAGLPLPWLPHTRHVPKEMLPPPTPPPGLNADAAVEGDEGLAASALAALAKVSAVGGRPVRATLEASNVLPLLHKVASGGRGPLRSTCMY